MRWLRWKTAGLALGATLLSCGASEITLRLIQPQLTHSRLLELTGEQYVECAYLPFTLKPAYTARAPSMEVPGHYVTVRTNALGLRGNERTLAKPPGVERIVILGDSYAFGVYVEDNETWPAVLEAELAGTRRVEVLNAGYADGWSPDEHYAWLANRGRELQPDLVIYGFFVGNDIQGYGMLERSASGWQGLDDLGLPHRVSNPEIYVDSVGRIRSRVRDSKTVGAEAVYRVPVLREIHLAILANRVADRLLLSAESRSMKLEPPMDFVFRERNTPRMDREEALFKRIVLGLAEACRRLGARFAVVMIPVNVQVDESLTVWGDATLKPRRDYFREIEPWFLEHGIPTLNVLELMRRLPGHYFPANGEVHCNPAGYRFIGQAAARFVRESELLASDATNNRHATLTGRSDGPSGATACGSNRGVGDRRATGQD